MKTYIRLVKHINWRILTFSYSSRVDTDIHQLPPFVEEHAQLGHEICIAYYLLNRLCGVWNDVVISGNFYRMVCVFSWSLVVRYIEEQLHPDHWKC